MTPFWKLHGLGNDFVVLRGLPDQVPSPDWVTQICDRHEGVGSDGLIMVTTTGPLRADMRMWNPDGSESPMCGNGLRCAAHWLNHHESHGDWTIALGRTDYLVERAGDQFAVAMGRTSVQPEDIGLISVEPWVDRTVELTHGTVLATAVSVGNPHLVFFVDEDPSAFLSEGETWEIDSRFKNRTNVHFARQDSPTELTMVTWERGAGPTLACGSGACAVAAAAFRTGRITGDVRVNLPGGQLTIQRSDQGLIMIGPAQSVFSGFWPDEDY